MPSGAIKELQHWYSRGNLFLLLATTHKARYGSSKDINKIHDFLVEYRKSFNPLLVASQEIVSKTLFPMVNLYLLLIFKASL